MFIIEFNIFNGGSVNIFFLSIYATVHTGLERFETNRKRKAVITTANSFVNVWK